MNTFIIVVLITYACIVRPIIDNRQMDLYHMWVWQVFSTLMIVVPTGMPLWGELSLLMCFAIGCMDVPLLSRTVRTVVFPKIRNFFQPVPCDGSATSENVTDPIVFEYVPVLLEGVEGRPCNTDE
jgi:hypothetical protein